MATTQSARAASTVQQRADVGPFVIVDSLTHALAANVTADDIIELIKVPRGARIQEVVMTITDMDTHGSPTLAFEVGDGGDTDRFITSSALGTTGGTVRINSLVGLNYQYTADDTIDIKWNTAAATFAAGSFSIVVMYRLDVI
jgi:hypothetical protein